MLSLCQYNTIHMIYFPLGNYAKAEQYQLLLSAINDVQRGLVASIHNQQFVHVHEHKRTTIYLIF